MSNIIQDANKYLHEKTTAFMTKERRLEKSAVLIEKLVKEIERRGAVIEAAKWLNLSEDWNKGAHAKIYRPKLLKALSQLESVKK